MEDRHVREGRLAFGPYETWYRVVGDLDSGLAPLVTLHGGPGATHDYLAITANLADTGRAVIHYDQLGCGRSTALPDRGADFWTVDLFLDELDNLLEGLGIARDYHLLGQSWGGMLGAEHAVRQPPGLRSLVISNSPASMDLWMAAAAQLRAELPPEVEAALSRHEADGTLDDPEYLAATDFFYRRHVCRVDPYPPDVARSFEYMAKDSTVYNVMNGPNEFHCVGTLRTWSIVDRLHLIVVPTLLISGRFDEAQPVVVQPFVDRVRDVRWEIFDESSHMPFVEEPERYHDVVAAFLEAHD